MPLSFLIRFTPPFFCELANFVLVPFAPFFDCCWPEKEIGFDGSLVGAAFFTGSAGLLAGFSFCCGVSIVKG
jgi:hypothetical protein